MVHEFRARFRVGAVLLMLMAAVLTGCTAPLGAAQTEAASTETPAPVGSTTAGVVTPAEPLFSPVDVSAAAGTQPRLSGTRTLSAGDGSSAILAGIYSPTSTAAELRVWTSADGATWTDSRLPLEGNIEYFLLDGNAAVTAAAGTRYVDGRSANFLLMSDDRQTWSEMALPDAQPDQGAIMLGVVDRRVLLLLDSDDVPTLLDVEDGVVTSGAFPTVADGWSRTPIAIAGHDSTVVVLAYLGAAESNRPAVAYLSTDGGASWADPVTVSGPLDEVNGMVWTGTEYALTGSRRADQGASAEFAAWSSADGVNWVDDRVEMPADVGFSSTDETRWLSRPAVAFGQVLALGVGNHSVEHLVLRRDQGVWVSIAIGPHNQIPGSSAEVAILGAPLAATGLPPVAEMVSNDDQSASIWRGITGDLPVTEVPINPGSRNPDLALHSSPDGSAELLATAVDVEVREDGFWTRRWTSTPYSWTADAGLVARPWGIPGIEAENQVERHASAAGAEVVLASGWDYDTSVRRIRGFYREQPAAEWQPVAGLNTQDGDLLYGLDEAAGQWIAYGATGELHRASVIWVSSNGHDWLRIGDTAVAHPDSALVNSCFLANGEPLIVGWWTDADGVEHPLAWTRDSTAGWTNATVEGAGTFDECSQHGTETVLTTQFDGETRTYVTTDGHTFTEYDNDVAGSVDLRIGRPAPPRAGDSQRFGVTAVAGGYYASGHVRVSEYHGFVSWFSRDGKHWRWVPLPAGFSGGSIAATEVNDEILVLLGTVAGPQARRISGLAEVFAG